MASLTRLFFFPAALAHIVPFRWQTWLKLLLFAFVFEGAFRKWILPDLSEFIYFSKDFILIIAVCKYLHTVKEKNQFVLRDNLLHWVIVLLFGYCVLDSFNPQLGSPVIGLFGIRIFFIGVPLVYIMQHAFSSRASLHRYLFTFVSLIVFVAPLSLIQLNSDFDAPINRYSNNDLGEGIAGIPTEDGDNVVRTTGTFSYISGFSLYSSLCLILIFPLFMYSRSRSTFQLQTYLTYFVILICALGSAFMTGSRAPVFFYVLYLIIRGFLFLMKGRKSFSPMMIVMMCLLVLAFYYPLYSVIDPWIQRLMNTEDINNRLIENPIDSFKLAGIFGYGTGRTVTGISALISRFNIAPPPPIPIGWESPIGRTFLELGFLGITLCFLLKFVILYRLLQIFDSLKSRFLQELAVSAFSFHLIYYSHFPNTNVETSITFWLLTAFITVLPVVEKKSSIRHHSIPAQKNNHRLPEDSWITSRSSVMGPYGTSLTTRPQPEVDRRK